MAKDKDLDRIYDESWAMWSKHVLMELERLNKCLVALDRKASKICLEVERLKVKSGVWGALGGLVPVLIVIAIYLVKTM